MSDMQESIAYFRRFSGPFLAGKAAVVNGADDALGQAIADGLATAGASVVAGSPCGSEPAMAEALVADAVGRFGRLDIVVNNPGLGECARLDQVTPQQMNAVLDEAVRGIVTLARCAAPELKRHGNGRIVTVSHCLAKTGSVRRGPHFAAAFAAIAGLTRELTAELFADGVTVNAVAPGNIAGRIAPDGDFPPEHIPLGREGTLAEAVWPVLFLCSDHANFITGVSLDVNGGAFMD